MAFLVQCSMSYDSGLPADKMVNTFHMITKPTFAGNYTPIANAFHDFYDETPPSPAVNPVRFFLSPALDPDTFTIKIYDLADAKPRVPKYDEILPLQALGSAAVPEEVACCLSYQAAPESGVPQARRRNRIYVGPLAQNAITLVGTRTAPAPAFINSLLGAASVLKAASSASTEFQWGVFSPTANSFAAVDSAWVDNAFDTQRRRGPVATGRTFTELPIP